MINCIKGSGRVNQLTDCPLPSGGHFALGCLKSEASCKQIESSHCQQHSANQGGWTLLLISLDEYAKFETGLYITCKLIYTERHIYFKISVTFACFMDSGIHPVKRELFMMLQSSFTVAAGHCLSSQVGMGSGAQDFNVEDEMSQLI